MSLTWVKRTVTRLPGIYVRVKNPVVSVGNITVGGSGKTPFILWLLEEMQVLDLSPVLITRGYKAKFSGPFARRLLGKWDREGFFGDELEMVLQKFPMLDAAVGKQRAILAKEFEKLDERRILIYEDAYQYFRLYRDLDIVIIHCQRGFGNRGIFPSGPLREGLFGLKRAKVLILYQLQGEPEEFLKPYRHYLRRNIKVFSMQSTLQNSSLLNKKRVIALASIAWPQSFLQDLKDAGAEVLSLITPGDHQGLSIDEQKELLNQASILKCDFVCMTAKDKPKWKIEDPRILVLHQKTEVKNGNELIEVIRNIKKAP